MANNDKKSILQEIEVLVRSIEQHYEYVRNKERIPNIELELITAKIRKLYEKSIIYNHLDAMEDTAMQQSKPMEFAKSVSPTPAATSPPQVTIEDKPNTSNTAPVANSTEQEAGLSELPKPEEAIVSEESHGMESSSEPELPQSASPEIVAVSYSETEAETNPPIETPEEISLPAEHETPVNPDPGITPMPSVEIKTPPPVKPINLSLNDRIWFSRELFGGNTESLNKAIQGLSQCSIAEFHQRINQMKLHYNWKNEEAEEGFLRLFGK